MNPSQNQEEEKSQFEKLPQEQQDKVLQFVGITNCEDLAIACQYLQATRFDLNRSIQFFFDGVPPQAIPGANGPHGTPTGDPGFSPTPGGPTGGSQSARGPPLQRAGTLPTNNRTPQQHSLHEEYKRYFIRKQMEGDDSGSITKMFSSAYNGVKGWFVTPPGGDRFIAETKKLGLTKGTFNLLKGKFRDNLALAARQKRPLLVLLISRSLTEGNTRQILISLMTNKAIVDFVNKNFLILGLINSPQDAEGLNIDLEAHKVPTLLVYRRNILENVILMDTVPVEQEVTAGENQTNIISRLQNSLNDFFFIASEEDNVRRDVERQIMQQQRQFMMQATGLFNPMYYDSVDQMVFGGGYQQAPRQRDPDQEARLIQDRIIREQQEESYQSELKKAKEREEQKRMMEERKKKEEEEAEYQRQQAMETRRKKKESLPAEPSETEENVMHIVFRLPDGNKLARRFLKNHTVGVMYDYLETLDNSTVDMNTHDIVMTHPFKVLDNKGAEISSIFDPDSTSEVLHIRERS